ncbi:MAG: hypothetical protein HYZ35_06140 [Chloroflexi bacterium]|nr:hypothetical protein [Chloroflexota bacterium]
MTHHRLPTTFFATLIFLLTWLVYAQILPYVMRTWNITGDEPHYLLAAHSLVHDGDLDLKNNYLNGDYRAFYSVPLDLHVRQQPDGAWLLSHDVGLPIAMAPAYAWGGRLGVMRFFALAGAALAAQLFLLGWETGGQWWAGALAALGLSLSAPLALYVFQIYPEMLGGLLLLWAMRQTLNTPAWLEPEAAPAPFGSARFWLLALCIAALPWFSGRYAPLALGLAALFGFTRWRERRAWLTVGGVALASLLAYVTINYHYYGGPVPSTTPAGNAVTAGFSYIAGPQVWRGLAAWLLDQQRGLFVYGPILIVAVFGLPHLWRLRRWKGLSLAAPLAFMWLLASVWGGFYIGWEISARFLIVGVPLLVAPIASIFVGIGANRGPLKEAGDAKGAKFLSSLSALRAFAVKLAFWQLVAGLLTLSVLNAALIFLEPRYAYKESPVKFYEEATRWQLRPYLPALGTRTIAYPPGGAPAWAAAAAEGPRYLYRSDGLNQLSVGWYGMYAQAQLSGAADPGAVALTFDVYSSETGIPLLHAEVRPADANPATGAVNVAARFYNPYYNMWDFPLYLDVQTTGAADVRLSWLLFEPDPAETYGRVGVWAGGIALLTVLFALAGRKR